MPGLPKILLVDDDPVNIYALSAILQSRGYDSLAASGAAGAICALRTNPAINLVLLDMMMPGIDGYHAISHLRQLPGRETLRVIAVTAQAMDGDREKCLAAGADNYLSKPVDVDLLLQMLQAYQ